MSSGICTVTLPLSLPILHTENRKFTRNKSTIKHFSSILNCMFQHSRCFTAFLCAILKVETSKGEEKNGLLTFSIFRTGCWAIRKGPPGGMWIHVCRWRWERRTRGRIAPSAGHSGAAHALIRHGSVTQGVTSQLQTHVLPPREI